MHVPVSGTKLWAAGSVRFNIVNNYNMSYVETSIEQIKSVEKYLNKPLADRSNISSVYRRVRLLHSLTTTLLTKRESGDSSIVRLLGCAQALCLFHGSVITDWFQWSIDRVQFAVANLLSCWFIIVYILSISSWMYVEHNNLVHGKLRLI